MKLYEVHMSEELGYDSIIYFKSNALSKIMELINHAQV